MTILIDKQEKTPWSLADDIETRPAHLINGDYALCGDGSFAIERKSLNDFLGTISSGWEQFQHEMYRMDRFGTPMKIIIVEGDFADCLYREGEDGEIVEPHHDHPALTPPFIMQRIAELLLVHRAAVVFAGSPAEASVLAERIFIERKKQLSGSVKFLKDLGGCK